MEGNVISGRVNDRVLAKVDWEAVPRGEVTILVKYTIMPNVITLCLRSPRKLSHHLKHGDLVPLSVPSSYQRHLTFIDAFAGFGKCVYHRGDNEGGNVFSYKICMYSDS
jgi:hypothetical protein